MPVDSSQTKESGAKHKIIQSSCKCQYGFLGVLHGLGLSVYVALCRGRRQDASLEIVVGKIVATVATEPVGAH
jgi:hypothetical protein